MLDLLLSFVDVEINDATTAYACWLQLDANDQSWGVNCGKSPTFLKIEIEIRKHLKIAPNSGLGAVNDAIIKNND